MAKSFKGLKQLVFESFPDAKIGGYFIFFNSTRDKMKVLYWDNNGFSIWYKQIEDGFFPKSVEEKKEIDHKEFIGLLNNVTKERYKTNTHTPTKLLSSTSES